MQYIPVTVVRNWT